MSAFGFYLDKYNALFFCEDCGSACLVPGLHAWLELAYKVRCIPCTVAYTRNTLQY